MPRANRQRLAFPIYPTASARANLERLAMLATVYPTGQRQRVKVYPPRVVELPRANRQRLAFPIYPTSSARPGQRQGEPEPAGGPDLPDSQRQGGDAGDVAA
ncbi:MAG: hypothetical protein P9F75_05545, partial [Candidatus Contendobacter sp.]|nr:hypothetical protein [Candidatus Contendobacter sp.]